VEQNAIVFIFGTHTVEGLVFSSQKIQSTEHDNLRHSVLAYPS